MRACASVARLSSARTPPEIWAVEGNISSGKTTLCRHLEEAIRNDAGGAPLPGACVVLEPVQQAFLERLYADPQRYAFAFQLNMMQTRITSLLRSQMATEGTFVLDRSVFGDSVFAVRNFLDGNIDEREMDIYEESRALRGYENLLPGPARMIYLDACPEVCHRRMVDVRQNEAEAGVPIEYLDGLDEVYVNAVLAQAARSDPAIDIVVMDASNGALIEGGRIHDIEELVLGEGGLDERRARWPRRSNVRLAQSSAEVGGGVLSSSSTAVYHSVEDCEASLEKLGAPGSTVAVFDWGALAEGPLPGPGAQGLAARTPRALRRRAMKHLERGDDVWLCAALPPR